MPRLDEGRATIWENRFRSFAAGFYGPSIRFPTNYDGHPLPPWTLDQDDGSDKIGINGV